ncbi:hypothetical protein NP493_152g01021 [Ridgeia piscesae]|uniref:Uncharacterized protein n=1 Tax=Ridgeia piscesae TaxID=27915 RepID=A0AAD9P4A3_RIDPI|nr:hypothetical protein NP493_152g01021 [Ridgeia piscesae]
MRVFKEIYLPGHLSGLSQRLVFVDLKPHIQHLLLLRAVVEQLDLTCAPVNLPLLGFPLLLSLEVGQLLGEMEREVGHLHEVFVALVVYLSIHQHVGIGRTCICRGVIALHATSATKCLLDVIQSYLQHR